MKCVLKGKAVKLRPSEYDREGAYRGRLRQQLPLVFGQSISRDHVPDFIADIVDLP